MSGISSGEKNETMERFMVENRTLAGHQGLKGKGSASRRRWTSVLEKGAKIPRAGWDSPFDEWDVRGNIFSSIQARPENSRGEREARGRIKKRRKMVRYERGWSLSQSVSLRSFSLCCRQTRCEEKTRGGGKRGKTDEGGNNIIRNDFISVYISARSRAEAVSNFISPHSPAAVSYQRHHRRGATIERGVLHPSFIVLDFSSLHKNLERR